MGDSVGGLQNQPPQGRPHQHRIRVRYGETDVMGIAHHGSYITWFEEARIEWLRAQGHSYRDLEAAGTGMPVIELQVRYRRPVRFDDEMVLTTTAAASGPSRVTFTTAITLDRTPICDATVTVATVDRDGRPKRIPAEILALLSPAI